MAYDLLIRNGMVADGGGGPAFRADLAVKDGRIVEIGTIGGAAAAAVIDAADLVAYLLGTWVRERQAMTLEAAVARLSAQPAALFGINGRGRLLPGWAADITVFDPARIGSPHRGERRFDLPGGGKRMVVRSEGVEATVVNGAVTWRDGSLTGATAGQVLRS